MARRYRSSRQGGRYASANSIGRERAREHIREAHALSHELGGTDADVKNYFFSLPPHQMDALLKEYGRLHGAAAEDYAHETLSKWKFGRVHMSGLVAARLFSLLPPRMPLAEKYKLTQGLWEHFGPSSKKRLRIGMDADIEATVQAVQAHFDEVVEHHRIPDQLERRFNWLAAGDVSVKQQLLNNLRAQERTLLSEGARLQLPVMIAHLRADESRLTTRMSQTLKIGKHELELLIDRQTSGFHLEEWIPPKQRASDVSRRSGENWGFWICVLIFVAYLLTKCSH